MQVFEYQETQQELNALKELREGKHSDLEDLKAFIEEVYDEDDDTIEKTQYPKMDININTSWATDEIEEMLPGSITYNTEFPSIEDIENGAEVLRKTGKLDIQEIIEIQEEQEEQKAEEKEKEKAKNTVRIKDDVQLSLFKTIIRTRDVEIQKEAVAQLSDQRLLDRILIQIKTEEIVFLALKNLTHPGLIVDYILEIETHGLTPMLIEYVKDQKMLAELVMNVDLDIRRLASQRILDDSLRKKVRGNVNFPCEECKMTINTTLKNVGKHITCEICDHKFRIPKRVKCQACGKKLFDTMIFCDCGGSLE